MAPMGARVNHSGSRMPWRIQESAPAGIDSQPLALLSADRTTTAAAPSFTLEALPGGHRPLLVKRRSKAPAAFLH